MANGISVSSTSNLSTGQKILVDAAMDAFEPAAPNPSLVKNVDVPQGHKQVEIGTYARLSSASALTEGTDLSQVEQLVANYLTLTPTEHGIIATLSKRLIRRQGDKALFADAGRQLAASLRRRQDLDVIAVYDTATKSIVGASTAMDITHFRGGVAYLRTDNSSSYGPAPMPLNASLHIEQISDIIADISDTAPRGTTVGLTTDVLQNWWRGSDRLYSVSIYESGNSSRDSNSDAKGAILSQEAVCLANAGDDDVTEQRDESARLIEFGVFKEWSEGLRADPHIVEVFSDAAATV